MTAGLALILGVVIWLASRSRWPPTQRRTPHVSDQWRRDHLYTDGKQGK
jgi:hypothetical protein